MSALQGHGGREVASPVDQAVIAIDAMGGDRAPAQIIEGVLERCAESNRERLLLVGDQEAVRAQVTQLGGDPTRFEFVHAPESIGMGDAAAHSVRRKPKSSIAVCTRLVKEGRAHALVSAGNTGAVVAASQLTLRRLPGVERPAIATYVPTYDHSGCILLDVGATSDCKPSHLVQFARMGAVYARVILERAEPRVGLLNIGEESSKGNELTQASHALLKESDVRFLGNVEGRDIFSGATDVVVCDGFTGNVLLKFSESIIELIRNMLRREMTRDMRSKFGAVVLKPAFKRFRKDLDYAEYGGAPLLGVNGVCIIAHGSSSPKAIKNAIRMAAELVERRINEQIVSILADDRAAAGHVDAPQIVGGDPRHQELA